MFVYPLCSNAEVENFNMSLSGDFTKDYCTISVLQHSRADLDISKIEGESFWGIPVGIQDYDIRCSAGTYLVTIMQDDEGRDLDNNLHYLQRVEYDLVGLSYAFEGYPSVFDLEFDGVLSLKASSSFYAVPLDENVSIPDTFSHTYMMSVTIDKVD